MSNYKGTRKQISLYLSEEARLAYKALIEKGKRPTIDVEKLLIKLAEKEK